MSGIYFNRSKPRLQVPSVILVEGPDDGYFLDEILRDLQMQPDDVGVCIADGKGNFPKLFSAVLKSPGFTTGVIRRIALIRDVDDDINSCSAEVSSLFQDENEPVPSHASFTARQDGRKLGLFLMPSGVETGSLETLALRTLQGSGLLAATEAFINTGPGIGGHLDHVDKRIGQAYLAVASDPLCAGTGWASRQGVYKVSSPALDPLKDFFRSFLVA